MRCAEAHPTKFIRRRLLMDVPPLILSPELKEGIESAGAAAYPNECCGLLIGRDVRRSDGSRVRVIDRIEAGVNVFEKDEQYHRFSIDPMQQLRAERAAEKEGRQLVGFYHSHPDHPAKPSEFDRSHAWPFYSYVIVSVVEQRPAEMTSWVLDDQTERFEKQEIRTATEFEP